MACLRAGGCIVLSVCSSLTQGLKHVKLGFYAAWKGAEGREGCRGLFSFSLLFALP